MSGGTKAVFAVVGVIGLTFCSAVYGYQAGQGVAEARCWEDKNALLEEMRERSEHMRHALNNVRGCDGRPISECGKP